MTESDLPARFTVIEALEPATSAGLWRARDTLLDRVTDCRSTRPAPWQRGYPQEISLQHGNLERCQIGRFGVYAS